MRFIEDLFRSLEKEMHQGFADASEQVSDRFDRLEARMDRMEARMDRIGGLVNGGSRALTRMIEWSEKQDRFQADTLRRLDTLEGRIGRLESERGEQQ